MTEFMSDLTRHAFLQYALLTGVLAGIACGIVGTYVVTRRIASVAGAIAHSILGGMGAARYCQVVLDWQWFHPHRGGPGRHHLRRHHLLGEDRGAGA